MGLPVKGLIRKTIFRHFVGGETLEETIPVARHLTKFGVQAILDYGVEGMEGEESYDHGRDEFIRVIHFAATQPNIPFISIKVTGMARFSLLEKLDGLMHASRADTLVKKYTEALGQISPVERSEWDRVIERVRKICEAAEKANIGF